jgi:hypothetical protein
MPANFRVARHPLRIANHRDESGRLAIVRERATGRYAGRITEIIETKYLGGRLHDFCNKQLFTAICASWFAHLLVVSSKQVIQDSVKEISD